MPHFKRYSLISFNWSGAGTPSSYISKQNSITWFHNSQLSMNHLEFSVYQIGHIQFCTGTVVDWSALLSWDGVLSDGSMSIWDVVTQNGRNIIHTEFTLLCKVHMRAKRALEEARRSIANWATDSSIEVAR